MRGIAALLVACIHISESFAPVASSGRWLHLIARDFAFGGIGVSLFFLVSGFVIPSSLKSGNSRLPELRQFVVRRFFRLYPVYWLSIALAVLIKFWIWNRDVELARILANVTMLQRFLGYEDIEGLYWTLATELVFYGLCAALFLAGVLNNARLLIAAALLFAAVYYPDALLGVPVRHGPLWFMFHTDISANLALMFVGALLRKWHDGQPIEGWVKFLLVCLIGVMMYPLTKSVTIVNEAIAWRFPPGGGRAIGLLIFLNFGLGLRLRHPLLTWLGEASYSIYLFHPVFIYGVLWIITRQGMERATGQNLGVYLCLILALTILWSAITYRWVEKPAIALGKRLGRPGGELNVPPTSAAIVAQT